MRFILFLISYALNPIIIFAVPSFQTNDFLLTYAISSGIFSLIFYWLFIFKQTVSQAKKWILVSSFLSIFLIFFENSFYVWIFYTFALLLGDYVTTQTSDEKLSNSYRGIMILSAIPFITYPQYFEILLIIRGFISVIFACIASLSAKKFFALNTRHSLRYLLITYTSFVGGLVLITLTTANPLTLKTWYVASQIGLGVLLKRLDFSLRSVNKDYKFIYKAINYCVLILPFAVMIISPEVKNLFIYLLCSSLLFLLIRLEQKEALEHER